MNLHVHDTISKICNLKQSHPDTKDNISEKQSYSKVRKVCEKVHAKVTFNKMAQVGIISKAQKEQKDFKISKCSLQQYLKNPKCWRVGDPFAFLLSIVAKHQKIERGPYTDSHRGIWTI